MPLKRGYNSISTTAETRSQRRFIEKYLFVLIEPEVRYFLNMETILGSGTASVALIGVSLSLFVSTSFSCFDNMNIVPFSFSCPF